MPHDMYDVHHGEQKRCLFGVRLDVMRLLLGLLAVFLPVAIDATVVAPPFSSWRAHGGQLDSAWFLLLAMATASIIGFARRCPRLLLASS